MNSGHTVYIVDDEEPVRKALSFLAKSDGLQAKSFSSAKEFLDSLDDLSPGCLLLDVCMPEMSGPEVQDTLRERKVELPVIVITGHADVATAVRAMKAGAVDFVEKPIEGDDLLQRIHTCLEQEVKLRGQAESRMKAVEKMERLTSREQEVVTGLVAGRRNKQIARDLSISYRTVELHRANIMSKLEANSLSDIVRTVLIAEANERS